MDYQGESRHTSQISQTVIEAKFGHPASADLVGHFTIIYKVVILVKPPE